MTEQPFTHDHLTALFIDWLAADDKMVALDRAIDALTFPEAPAVFATYEEGAAYRAAWQYAKRQYNELCHEREMAIRTKADLAYTIGSRIGGFPSPVQVTLADGTIWYVSTRLTPFDFDIRAEKAGEVQS